MFGRKKGQEDDPFAALKQGVAYQSTPTTTIEGMPGTGLGDAPEIPPLAGPPAAATVPPPPATAPAPPPMMGPTSQTGVRPRRPMLVRSYANSSVSGPARIITTLIVVGVVLGIVIPIVSSTTRSLNSIKIPKFNFGSATSAGGATSAPATPKPPPIVNYLNAGSLRSGLSRIAKQFPGARLSTLRLDAHSLDATATIPHHGVKNIDFTATGTFITSGAAAGGRAIPVAAIPPSAVTRIVTGMKRRFHVPKSRIDYTVLNWFAGERPQWITFSKAPSHPGFAANVDGTGLHALGS
jgi:hypothetical protein